MSKHTKGPWTPSSENIIVGNEESWVASIIRHSDKEVQEANARLIANAPEMYDMLEELVVIMQPNSSEEYKQRRLAADLIKKIDNA